MVTIEISKELNHKYLQSQLLGENKTLKVQHAAFSVDDTTA